MQVLAVQTRDPVRLCWSSRIAVHPMHLQHLCSACIGVLAEIAGIERGNRVFAPLWYAVTWQDLARIPWGHLTERLRVRASLPAEQLEGAVEHVRLFADRAVLHHRLYLAKSGTTLQLLRKCYLPAALPLELIDFAVEFHKHLREMDEALRTGRASLDHFQRQALLGEPFPVLRAILDQAQACAEAYSSAYTAAYQIAEGVDEYLAWRASRKEEDPSLRSALAERQQPATRAALAPSAHGSDRGLDQGCPSRKRQAKGERHHTSATLPHASATSRALSGRSNDPSPGAARSRDALSTRRGGFTVMPGSPESELLAFCVTCPLPSEVIEALAGLGFTLTFTMEEQRFPAYSQTPPIPPQFHFRDEHGTEVIYLAGKDAGEEGERLPPHAARFWIYPGASTQATQLAAQFCATKWPLSWQHSARVPKREAVA